jgi:lipid-A-disaccharide synthase
LLSHEIEGPADKSVVMVAGEASGDLHGAHVIEALLRIDRDISVSGAGGMAMRNAGASIVLDIKELSIMGITAVLMKAPRILKSLSRLKRLLAHTRPDLLILIDFPDFNLHLAGYAKKLGLKVLYYISPTVWAWRPNRIKKIKKRVDHMAVILPFEKSIYDRHDIPSTYVGHPLLDDAVRRPMHLRARRLTPPYRIALLPGSREEEVERLLPDMVEAARLLQSQYQDLRVVVSCAPSIDPLRLQEMADTVGVERLQVVREPVGTLFAKCDLAVVASGTASLEAAIYGIPNVIVYRVSGFNYWLAKKMVHVPHIGLANLIARERIFPELVQEEATAENIVTVVQGLLDDPSAYEKMLHDIDRVQEMIGTPGASDRVAAIASRLMGGRFAA